MINAVTATGAIHGMQCVFKMLCTAIMVHDIIYQVGSTLWIGPMLPSCM